MNRNAYLLPLICLLVWSCKSESVDATSTSGIKPVTSAEKSAEIIEIYNAKIVDDGYEIGTLRYREHNEYHGEQLYGTLYYNQDGTIRGKTVMVYQDGSELPTSSRFLDPRDSLLSFYKYEYDDAGNKSRVIAFDPVANEILREERFYYGKNGQPKIREIRDAEGKVRQRFNWTYDQHGNETAMMVDSGENTPLMTHIYKIIKYDDHHLWTEKWTFIDDEPSTYHKITRRS